MADKLWQAQFGSFAGWQATPFMPTWIFSVVVAVRCEVQANDQSWSGHRLAFTLPDGSRDTSLEFALEQMSSCRTGRAGLACAGFGGCV